MTEGRDSAPECSSERGERSSFGLDREPGDECARFGELPRAAGGEQLFLAQAVAAANIGYDFADWGCAATVGFMQLAKPDLVPPPMPKEVLAQLNGEIIKMLYVPDMKERLAAIGLEPAAEPLDKTNAYIKSEIAKWAQAVRAANITAD